MDILLIILIIIIILLGFLNIRKDIYESFTTNNPSLPQCTQTKINNIESYNLPQQSNCNLTFVNEEKYQDKQITNYTISLVFTPPTNNSKQYLLCYKDKWCVYIENNTLYLTDTQDTIKEKEYGNENIIRADLNKQNPKTYDLQSLGESDNNYYHLAIVVKKLTNKSKVFLFLNGLIGDITIDSDSKSIPFQELKKKVQIGFKEETNKYKGTVLDLKFFNKTKNEEELCALWESCNLCDYSLKNSSATTENECLTECNKLCSSSQCKTKCKDWKPKCSFEPSGNTVHLCKDECNNDQTNSCWYNECSQICNECTDTISCPWNKKTDDVPIRNLDLLTCKQIVPPELHFNVLTGNKLKIMWDHPKQINSDSTLPKLDDKYDANINMFILIIKTIEINDGNRIITKHVDQDWIKLLNNDNPTQTYKSKKWSPTHSYILDNLDEDTEYIISCKSVIQNGGGCDTTTVTPTEAKHTISDSSYKYNITLSSLKSKFLKDRA